MKILNLTQHTVTPAHIRAGVYEPDDDMKESILEALTFHNVLTREEMDRRALVLCRCAAILGAEAVMIDSDLYFRHVLEEALRACGFPVLYASSRAASRSFTYLH